MKKGISLIILIITIIIILILSGAIISKTKDMTNDIDGISFDNKIRIIEKAIKIKKSSNKLNNNELVGMLMNNSIYSNFKTEIDEIEAKYNINIKTSNQYYYLNTKDLLKLNIKDIQGEYLVNYQNGIVFSLNPLVTEDESVYTTQEI